MTADKTILIVGTYDTKDAELAYLADVIRAQGGRVITMDVSVLGDPSRPTDLSKHEVAAAGGHTIAEAVDSGDENVAMQIMARGAALQAARLHGAGRVDGVLVESAMSEAVQVTADNSRSLVTLQVTGGDPAALALIMEAAIDELLEVEGMDEERAGALIMTARAPWFAESAE